MEVYLDNSATTRCFPEAAKLMYKVMTEDYGNPSSLHQKGVDAEKYVREAITWRSWARPMPISGREST